MFQLILGSLLGLLLLFVILLGVTEVIANYPIWKNADELWPPAGRQQQRKTKHLYRLPLLLLLGAALLGGGITGFFISHGFPGEESASVRSAEMVELPGRVFTKTHSDSMPGYGLTFVLQTKWEDGKLYGNNRIKLGNNAYWRFADCRYFLLDAEGYLIKALSFTQNDFVFETTPDGKPTALINRFQVVLPFPDYEKMETLQVALDRKLSAPALPAP